MSGTGQLAGSTAETQDAAKAEDAKTGEVRKTLVCYLEVLFMPHTLLAQSLVQSSACLIGCTRIVVYSCLVTSCWWCFSLTAYKLPSVFFEVTHLTMHSIRIPFGYPFCSTKPAVDKTVQRVQTKLASMLNRLELEIQSVEKRIGDKMHVLDRDKVCGTALLPYKFYKLVP